MVHHHVHQLPGVGRSSLHRYPTDPSYVRISHNVIRRIWHRGVDIHKSLTIGAFGRALRKVAARSGITANEDFSGIYDFNKERIGLTSLFGRFLQSPGSGMLTMCHPGCSDLELRRIDSLTTKRNAELAFLLSDEWPQLLLRIDFSLAACGGSANSVLRTRGVAIPSERHRNSGHEGTRAVAGHLP